MKKLLVIFCSPALMLACLTGCTAYTASASNQPHIHQCTTFHKSYGHTSYGSTITTGGVHTHNIGAFNSFGGFSGSHTYNSSPMSGGFHSCHSMGGHH